MLRKIAFVFVFVLFSFSFAVTYNITGKLVYANGTGVPNANISLFNENFGQGPPTYTLNASNMTTGTGAFTLYFDIPTGGEFNTLLFRVKKYNASGALTHMGPLMPPMPAQFMSMMINQSNMTVYPAATLFFNATRRVNSTNATEIPANFSGSVMDSKYGFMLRNFMPSFGQGGGGDFTYNVSIDLLRDRNYTLSVFKMGNPMAMERGAAPRSIIVSDNNLTNNVNNNGTFGLTVNLTDASVSVTGNISINATGMPLPMSGVNCTDIVLYPYAFGKVPINGMGINPTSFMSPPPGEIGFAASLNCSSGSGSYNLTAMASAGGISYLMVVYAFNGTPGQPGARYFASMQNFTVVAGTNISNFNLTLRDLAGSYVTPMGMGAVNTSNFLLHVKNNDSNNAAVGEGGVEVTVNYTNPNGQGNVNLNFISMPNSSGTINFPVFNNTRFKAKMFSQRFAPAKKTINSTVGSATMYLTGMRMQKPNSTQEFTTMGMMFLKSNSSCNVQEPDLRSDSVGGCLLANFTAGSGGDFNPMKLMMNGENINIHIQDASTGVTSLFIGVDMFASGPPNMQMPDGATSDNSSGQTYQKKWRFGSVAPDVFSYAFVGIPYSDATMNESQNISVLMDALYDEDWNAQWSSSEGAGSVPADFADYNNTMLNASAGGLLCSSNNTGNTCYVNNATNRIWIRVPHFSGVDPVVSGGSVSLQGSSSSSSSSSSSGGSSTKPLAVSYYNLSCPGNLAEARATSSGTPVSDVLVRLILYEPYGGFVKDMLTGNSGSALFDMSNEKEGKYQIDGVRSGYKKPDSAYFDFVKCSMQQEASVQPKEQATAPPAPEPAAVEPSPPPAEVPKEEPKPEVKQEMKKAEEIKKASTTSQPVVPPGQAVPSQGCLPAFVLALVAAFGFVSGRKK